MTDLYRLQGGMTVCWSTVADVSLKAKFNFSEADEEIIGRKPVYLTSFGVRPVSLLNPFAERY
jgi:hypothetical protein